MTETARRDRGGPPRVEVVGTGTATATPDVIRLSLGVRCEAEGVGPALTEAAGVVRGVSAAARAHGLADADIGSTGASASPRWDREGSRVVGYTAHHHLTLRVRQIERLNDLVAAVAASAGNALTVDSIALDLADRGPLQASARAAAFADAQDKATQYAGFAQASLGRVLRVLELPAQAQPRPGPMPMAMARSAGESAALPVEAGEQTVGVTVQVAWELVLPPP
ncbi:MAG: SIMPL domain-containing protein [Dermatophilaceae bacterium]